jgi:hypothetical protein
MAACMQSEREPRRRMHEVVAGPLHMVNGQRLPDGPGGTARATFAKESGGATEQGR